MGAGHTFSQVTVAGGKEGAEQANAAVWPRYTAWSLGWTSKADIPEEGKKGVYLIDILFNHI